MRVRSSLNRRTVYWWRVTAPFWCQTSVTSGVFRLSLQFLVCITGNDRNLLVFYLFLSFLSDLAFALVVGRN